jgi:hypothetical protein
MYPIYYRIKFKFEHEYSYKYLNGYEYQIFWMFVFLFPSICAPMSAASSPRQAVRLPQFLSRDNFFLSPSLVRRARLNLYYAVGPYQHSRH